MRIILAGSALVLAAACAPAAKEEPATPAAPAAEVTQAPPAVTAPAGIALPTVLLGRWGITAQACAPTNDAKDGVFEITATTVQMGLDACTTASATPEGEGTHLVVQCKSGEGGADYQRDFSFVSASPDTLTWITEGGEHNPYTRCK